MTVLARPPVALLVALALGAAACSPYRSPGLAADECEARARASDGIVQQVRVGTGSGGGVRGGVDLAVTSDYLKGRAPQEVYENCVFEKTGQGPVRPLDLGR